jgi:hypothetical protein
MSLLPRSTNTDYRGAKISAWFLCLAGLVTVVPGLVHYLLPDGGAGVIAHIDLGARADTIIALFAWYGAMQIPFGLLILTIAVRYRSLVPLTLLLVMLVQALGAISAWLWKGSHSGNHPPEHYASVAFLIVATPFLVLSLIPQRDRPGNSSRSAGR